MSIWNGNYQPPLWSGTTTTNINGITSNQLISTVNGLGTIGYISSSQLISSITSIDNILSTILSTSAGGGSNNLALWSYYKALSNIDANGNSLVNANNVNSSNINTNNLNGYLGNDINVNNTLIVNSNFRTKGVSSLSVSTNLITTNILFSPSNNLNIATDINLSNNNIRNVSQIDSIFGNFSNVYASNIKVINISTSLINASTISTNYLSLSSIGGTYGIYLSTTIDELLKASTNNVSLWSKYPAIQTVNISNNNIDNVQDISISNNAYINRAVVRGGGLQMEGNAQFNKIDYGNYHNFTMDANVTVANANTLSCPNYSGYYSNYSLNVNSFDVTGYFTNAATTNASLNLYTNQTAFLLGTIPFGHADLLSHNYQITFPPVIGTTYKFRSGGKVGSDGGGANAYIQWNQDTTALVPNTAATMEINVDSVFTSLGALLGAGRFTASAGVNQLLATYSNVFVAGYASILAPFTFANICGIKQYAPFSGLGGGITTIETNGGGEEFGAKGLGARTDLVANNWLLSNDIATIQSSEMNLFCTDKLYVYTEGDLYLGAGSNGEGSPPLQPRYGSNRGQRVHLSNLIDISPNANVGVVNFYGDLDMCNHSIFNVNLYLSSASFSTILTGHLDISNNIYQSNALNTTINAVPYYPYIQTNALQMYNSFSSIQSYISTAYTPARTQTITDTPHNIYDVDFNTTFYSAFTLYASLVRIQSGNGTLDFYNNGTTSMNFNFYFTTSTTPILLPGQNFRLIISNSNSYIQTSIPTPQSTIVSSVSINKTNFYQYMYDSVLSIDISGQNLTNNFSNKGNFYINASTINIGGSNNGGYPLSDEPNYPIKMVYDTQFDNNISVSNITSTRELDISGNAGGVAIYFNNDNNNLTYTFNDVGTKNIDYDDASFLNTNTIQTNGLGANSNSFIFVYDNIQMNYKDLSGVTNLRIGGSATGNTNLSNDSNGYFHITNSSNLIALDNPAFVNTITFPYNNPIFGANNGTLVFQNTLDLSNNYIINVNGLFADTISPNNVAQVQFTSPIRVDYINPYIQDYVTFAGNGIKTDQIGSDVTPYTGFNNDINLFGNSILDVSGITLNNINPNNSNNTIYTPQDTILAIDTLSNVRDGDRGTIVVESDLTINKVLHVDSITTNSNSVINFNAEPINDIQSVSFINGSAIGETTQGGSNWLSLSNQTIVNSNLQIVNGVSNPSLIFNNGRKNIISVDSNNVFLFNDNISTNTAIVKNLTSGVSNDLFLANKINVLNTLDLSANNIVNLNTLNIGVNSNATLQLYTDSSFAYLNMNNSGTLYNKQPLNQQGKGVFYGDNNNDLHISTFGSNHYVYADTLRFITSSISTSYIIANAISTNTLSVGNIENVSSITCGNISTNSLSVYQLENVSSLTSGFISTNSLSVYQVENISSLVANSIQASKLSSQTINASTGTFLTFLSAPTLTTTTLNAYQISNVLDTRIRFLQGIIPQTAGITNGTSASPWTATYSSSNYGILNNTSTLQVSSITSINTNSNISIIGNVSAPQMMISSINNKVYPFWSTLNIPNSTFTINGNNAGTPIVLYSNVQFPPYTKGFYKISQKAVLTKKSGGASADIHANMFYTQGTFPSTPAYLLDGYSAFPYVNQDACSSFTTLQTMVNISSITTRNICYYDSTANNYTADLYVGNLVVQYTPTSGYNIDTGASIGF